MRKIYFLSILTFSILACKSVELTTALTNSEAGRIYKKTLNNTANYQLKYNADSAYAIIWFQEGSLPHSQPISFFIYDIVNKENLHTSIKEYQKVEWQDSITVRMMKFKGMPKSDNSLTKSKHNSNLKIDFLNVVTGEIREVTQGTEKL